MLTFCQTLSADNFRIFIFAVVFYTLREP